ncbi:LysR family transcriptional regulator ArgP [Peteryoungia desertarenae]|uniref:LysR family transcriptional regulator ArgP n=1 Tax=Peteryoungia desertarenae TaxID=1813451 RepID=A0ABX6QRL2_9HYPH|nr:LysR family transcriptional regulator ArgP [Peteryoungia desertarenae]QLF70906.1 LysR family transcriptional regulator ArgP [Peteryoungia desertarenae]
MIDAAQLAALAAVLRLGSFDRAARQLGVTSSAISQRIRLLEERIGAVLVIRSQPCEATETGLRVLRHAEEVGLLEQALRRELGLVEEIATQVTVRLAVNADSLATWFIDAMAETPDLLFDLVLDDQDHSADWLKRGEVRAAISSSPHAVQGCDCLPLGALRYVATASPAFVERWFPAGRVTVASMTKAPALVFNRKDRLQQQWTALVLGEASVGPCHWLPSSQAFVDAAVAGLGWGMNPEGLVRPLIDQGRLAALLPKTPLDVPLYWHVSRSVQSVLRPLTKAVTKAAGRHLRPIEKTGP